MDERWELQLLYKLSFQILDGLIIDTSAPTWYVAAEYHHGNMHAKSGEPL